MLVEKVDLCPVKLKKMLGVLCLCHPSVELSPMKLVKNNRRILVVRKNWRKIGPFRHWTLKLILRLNYVYTSIYIHICVHKYLYIYIWVKMTSYWNHLENTLEFWTCLDFWTVFFSKVVNLPHSKDKTAQPVKYPSSMGSIASAVSYLAEVRFLLNPCCIFSHPLEH